jgi:hypothetical protein
VVERAWLDAERRGKNGRNEEKIVVASWEGWRQRIWAAT